jgi:nicotinamidase-related amidase
MSSSISSRRTTDSSRIESEAGSLAVLLVDVINDFDFPGAEPLIAAAAEAAPKIQELASRARRARVPVLYVNDNFGHWRSDFRATIERCCEPQRPGAGLVRRLVPEPEDVFVLKPMHSGFFHTPLELVLRELETKRVILCGFAANLCVAFTAFDAHMRGLRVSVPCDTTAANTPELCAQALDQLATSIGADIRAASEIELDGRQPHPDQ